MGNVAIKSAPPQSDVKATRNDDQDVLDDIDPRVDDLARESTIPSQLIIVNAPKPGEDSPVKAVDSLSLTEDDTTSLISCWSDHGEVVPSFKVHPWDGKKHFSGFVRDGMIALQKDTSNVVMLYESPSSYSHETSFFNGQVYRVHDYPPLPPAYKAILGPCRYSMVNGDTFPSYLRDPPPDGLMGHWLKYVPGFVEPSLVHEITNRDVVYAYLPLEHVAHHAHDPHVHYHLAGKDAIALMTSRTTKLLANTQEQRPCLCKTTHSMGAKGIYVIRNDQDEADFNTFLEQSGNPTFVITEYIEIARNVACHFFIHPNDGSVTWFGSNENRPDGQGGWSSDSTIVHSDQEELRELQLPFVKDVVHYCRSLGFWGFCGIDVLFDTNGVGYVVDVNPRVTGSCPAIMVHQRIYDRYGYDFCLFRRNSNYAFRGTAEELLQQVDAYNAAHEGNSLVILNSFSEVAPQQTLINIIVFSRNSLDECQAVLDHFAPLA